MRSRGRTLPEEAQEFSPCNPARWRLEGKEGEIVLGKGRSVAGGYAVDGLDHIRIAQARERRFDEESVVEGGSFGTVPQQGKRQSAGDARGGGPGLPTGVPWPTTGVFRALFFFGDGFHDGVFQPFGRAVGAGMGEQGVESGIVVKPG